MNDFPEESVVKRIKETKDKLEVTVELSNGAIYRLTAADFRATGITDTGDYVDNELSDMLANGDLKLRCIKKAFDYVAYGQLSKKTLVEKLVYKAKFNREIAQATAEALEERRYINDYELCTELFCNYVYTCRMGVIKAKSKLVAKGFDKKTINDVADDNSPDDQTIYENLEYLVESKVGTDEISREEYNKLVPFLVRNGYSYEDIGNFYECRYK